MLPIQDQSEEFFQIALTFVPEVGPKTARALLSRYPSARDIFNAKPKELVSVEGMGEARAKRFKDKEIFKLAEKEVEFCTRNDIQPLFMTSQKYPKRFIDCDDAPVLLYYKGSADLNAAQVVAIIGTRKHTDYGQRATEDLVEGLQGLEDVIVISGLALGIDTIAHKSALKSNIPTVGVVGHGLDMIYPSSNKTLANDMLSNGGLLSEFPSETPLDRGNFPVRNRVVAGMSDITVLVESDIKGGGMITAYVAHSYNREVAAFPGRVYDSKSGGPNHLIKKNVAAMITSADDLLELMNWGRHEGQKAVQKQLFFELSPEESKVVDLLKERDAVHSDELLHQTGFKSPQLAATLLQLEMQGVIKTLPGKYYRMK
jgi:DNA processing protein